MDGPSNTSGVSEGNLDYPTFKGGHLSSTNVGKISAHTVTFVYPFSGKYTQLTNDTTDPARALRTKEEIEGVVARIHQEGVNAGVNDFFTEWAVHELARNATQYAGVGKNSGKIPQVEFEWVVDANEEDPCLILAISNSCPTLFNPSKYSNTPFDDLPEDENQGHQNLLALPGMVKPGTLLTYRWHTSSSEVITCKMSYFGENDPDRPELNELATPAIRLTVTKCGNRGSALPYSTAQFLHDVSEGLPTILVTATCVIGKAGVSMDGDFDGTNSSTTNNDAL